MPRVVVETTLARLLDPDAPVHGHVALRDGLPVGLVHVVFHANLIQVEPTCYMQDLFTLAEARNSGVAQALIQGVLDLCRAHGALDVYWHTHESNQAARRLYDRVARKTVFLVYRIKPLSR